ncbi:MAG TPA: NAD(P)-dependent oxidoreductase [Micromonosporaceae bacterium]
MRILVTGSTGWLGRHLIPLLRSHGHDTVGLDVAAGPSTDVIGSVADRTAVDAAFETGPIDAVVHSAALHKPDIARYGERAFHAINVVGTGNVLAAATAAGAGAVVFTSSTSLMISSAVRSNTGSAVWIDEDFGPIEPRNVYGVTKLEAEHACRDAGVPVIVLRTSRFFPEADDELTGDGLNVKANELLYRRLTVHDAAAAHLVALRGAHRIGYGVYIVSAPTPLRRSDAAQLGVDAPTVIAGYYPQAADLYARRGWTLPPRIDRVYDAGRADRDLGFRAGTDFGTVLSALERGEDPPIEHDPSYISPKEARC